MARNATPLTTFSALSSFKKSSSVSLSIDRSQTTPCPDCGQKFHPFKQKNGVWNAKPHKLCLDCWRSKRRRSVHSREKSAEMNALDSMSTSDHVSQVSAVTMRSKIFTKGEWRRAKVSKHPTVEFELRLPPGKRAGTATVVGLADTGAQSNLWGLQDFIAAGFKLSDLESVRMDVRAANKNPINIVGGFLGRFSGKSPSAKVITCQSMVYISNSVSGFYLSYDTMLDMDIIDRCFPTIGGCAHANTEVENNSRPIDMYPDFSYLSAC